MNRKTRIISSIVATIILILLGYAAVTVFAPSAAENSFVPSGKSAVVIDSIMKLSTDLRASSDKQTFTRKGENYSIEVFYAPSKNMGGVISLHDMLYDEMEKFKAEVALQGGEPNPNGAANSLHIDCSNQKSANYETYVCLISSYTGGANVMSSVRTSTVDEKGETITLETIFDPKSDYLKVLSTETKAALSAIPELSDYVENPDWQKGFAPKAENFDSFSLSNDGITIYFDKYQVAPGVLGNPEVTIPFSVLSAVLKV